MTMTTESNKLFQDSKTGKLVEMLGTHDVIYAKVKDASGIIKYVTLEQLIPYDAQKGRLAKIPDVIAKATKEEKNIAGGYREPIWKKDPKAEPWIDFIPAFRTATDIARASLSDTDLEEIMKSYGVSDLIGNYEKNDDYKKAYIRVKREKDPKLSAGIIKSGFKYDPAMLGTQERFARGGLTRTVAPDSEGIMSLKK